MAKTPLIVRLMSKVVIDDGCWLWTGAKTPFGHGIIGLGGRRDGTDRAHRVMFRLFRHAIGTDDFICHKCDVPNCVRPSHLFLGNAKVNHQDMVSKGRMVPPPRNFGDANYRRQCPPHGSLNPAAKIDATKAAWAREQWAAGATSTSIAVALGISRTSAHKAATGKTWRQ